MIKDILNGKVLDIWFDGEFYTFAFGLTRIGIPKGEWGNFKKDLISFVENVTKLYSNEDLLLKGEVVDIWVDGNFYTLTIGSTIIAIPQEEWKDFKRDLRVFVEKSKYLDVLEDPLKGFIKRQHLVDEIKQEKKCNIESKQRTEEEYVELFSKYLELGMPPQIFIDSLIPVVLNTRKCSLFFADQIWVNKEEEIVSLLNELEKDFGISLKKLSLDEEKSGLISFLFKDKEVYNKIEKVEEYVKSNTKEKNYFFGDEKFLRLVGDILGFPKCCVNNFIKTRKDGFELEQVAFEDILNNKFIDKRCYFAMEFYPCSPLCKEASHIGNKITHFMGNGFLGELWNLNLASNLDIVMNPRAKWSFFAQILNDRIFSLFVEEDEGGPESQVENAENEEDLHTIDATLKDPLGNFIQKQNLEDQKEKK